MSTLAMSTRFVQATRAAFYSISYGLCLARLNCYAGIDFQIVQGFGLGLNP